MRRLTVRPSAEIGRRNGSEATASSGKACGRRWMIMQRTASATAALAAASTAPTVVVLASVTHTRASPSHQREAARRQDRPLAPAQGNAHAVLAGGRQPAAVGREDARVAAGAAHDRIAAGGAEAPVPAQRQRF